MSSRPRSPGLTFTGLVVVLLVMLAAFALTQRTPPPPTIAEFAPQSLENITDAPNDQSSSSGTGEGPGGGGGGGGGSSPATSAAVDVPRVRKCVGDPPRQTEDPQSPPCVPYWTGDNGGATSKGVTRDEVLIAFPETIEEQRQMDALEAFFNKRYEFYGRKLSLKRFTPVGGGGGGEANVSAMTSDAVTVDESMHAFGSISYPDREGAEYVYYDELARRKIISVNTRPGRLTEADHFARFDPYEWGYLPGVDVMQRAIGNWICGTLVGRPPIYGGTGTSDQPVRRFGLLNARSNGTGTSADLSELRRILAGCGASPVAEADAGGGTDAALAMKVAGATSVICMCHGQLTFAMAGATAQSYNPEWLISTYLYNDYDFSGNLMPDDHARRAFGLTFWNRFAPADQMPWYWAVKEGDPGSGTNYIINLERYEQLLVIAAGIQLAGPKLTPQSFRDGLMRARFPNPAARKAPFYQGFVDFSPGDHTVQDDAAMIWWDRAERSYTNSTPGTFCWVRHGERTSADSWPRQEPAFFLPPCR